ncbi:hypothetical protein N9219_04810 [bacterium]|nr:hypothetical protein [bacterium]
MMLESGVKKIDQNGNKVYINSPANIKALIVNGVLNNEIVKSMKLKGNNGGSAHIRFNVSIPDNLNILNISYDTPRADQAIEILKCLQEVIVLIQEKKLNIF